MVKINADEILKKHKIFCDGVQRGRELAVQQYDKILIEIYKDLQIIKEKLNKIKN